MGIIVNICFLIMMQEKKRINKLLILFESAVYKFIHLFIKITRRYIPHLFSVTFIECLRRRMANLVRTTFTRSQPSLGNHIFPSFFLRRIVQLPERGVSTGTRVKGNAR